MLEANTDAMDRSFTTDTTSGARMAIKHFFQLVGERGRYCTGSE